MIGLDVLACIYTCVSKKNKKKEERDQFISNCSDKLLKINSPVLLKIPLTQCSRSYSIVLIYYSFWPHPLTISMVYGNALCEKSFIFDCENTPYISRGLATPTNLYTTAFE